MSDNNSSIFWNPDCFNHVVTDRKARPIPLTKITGQGLCAIAALVGILWGCLLVDRLTVSRARADGYQALSEIRSLQLKKHIAPAAVPQRPSRPGTRPVLG